MKTLTVDVPEQVLAATRQKPDEFLHEMRLVAAATWYSQGKLSQEMAAQLAGLDRTDFLLALARLGVDSFPVDLNELDQELRRE